VRGVVGMMIGGSLFRLCEAGGNRGGGNVVVEGCHFDCSCMYVCMFVCICLFLGDNLIGCAGSEGM